MKKRSILALTALLLLTLPAAGTAKAGTPEEAVASYHQALLDGDIDAAKGMLAEELLLFEDGQVETSMKHYAEGHLKSDIEFSAGARRKLESQTSWAEGDTATVISTYDLKTRYKNKRYHVKVAETMTLKKTDDQWFIVHVHWSNQMVK